MSKLTVKVPDIGTDQAAEVAEVLVAEGDSVDVEQSIIVLETDKASVEVPSSHAGKVLSVLVKEGDALKTGSSILQLETEAETEGKAKAAPAVEIPTAEGEPSAGSKEPSAGSKEPSILREEASAAGEPSAPDEQHPAPAAAPSAPDTEVTEVPTKTPAEKPAEKPAPVKAPQPPSQPAPSPAAVETPGSRVYAGPAVRKLARQLGVDLTNVKSTGPRNRHTKDDVRAYVRDIVSRGGTGAGIPPVPAVDFAKFGDIKRAKMSKIKRATAANMHRSWLNVPHVTQFDEADITGLETYRKEKKAEAEQRGTKLTPVPFLLKACALTLQAEPSFNVSLDPDAEHIIEKQYIHIGMAVDAPGGLIVPVIRNADQKDIWQLAEESITLASKAREGKLSPAEMQGGCFTISSLGAIGGQGFTPVVNTPEVGILGVSKAAIKPYWDGKTFIPHTFLPLSLSYDHRAVNGADAGRFLTHLVGLLSNYQEWVG